MVSNTVKQFIAFVQIILVTLSAFGLSYVPSALQHDIQDQFNIDTTQYGLLFSMSSWTSLFDVLHGYLLDRYLGIMHATILYAVTLLIGCILFCIAGYTKSFWLFVIGRTVYGFGLTPIMLCTNKHIIRWFTHGKHINLVYSFNESVLWLGSSACYFISVNLYKTFERYKTPSDSLGLTISIETMILCGLTMLGTLTLAIMYGDEKTLNKSEKNPNKIDNLTWKDYLSLSWLFWIFAFIVFIYFVSIVSFLSVSQVYFEKKYNLDTAVASNLSGLITIVSFFLSPPFGYLLDKIGQNLSCMTAAYILNIASHAVFTWCKTYPLIPVIMMAISLVLSCSLWSQFQYLVEEYQYMIAYGVAQTGFSFALAIGTLVSGYLIDKYGYDEYMIYLFALIVFCLPALLLAWILNYRRGNLLNLNPRRKMIFLERTSPNVS